MSRVHIDLPEVYVFKTELAVQIGDINYGQHLANDAVLRLCHEARLRWLQAWSFTELDVDGCGLIMADAAIQFRRQAFHGDVLCFELGVAELGSAGFSLVYRISRGDEEVARVKNGLVFFDYARQAVSKTPAAFSARLAQAVA